jgi:predicted hotdog family 3-hydroxylacyl-ACP dehydratase
MHPFLTNYTRKKIIAAGDPYFNNVTLLMHCDGTDGSTTFTDVKGHTITRSGNTQIDTAQSKFGGASALFDGTGDYILVADHADWDLPGNFTIEFWYRRSVATYGGVIRIQGNNTIEMGIDAVQRPEVIFGSTFISSDTQLSINEWHHVALVRSSNGTNGLSVYSDGIKTATDTYTTNLVVSAITIGGVGFDYYIGFNGHLDDIRITKGVARYTTNFTPPTAAFPDS